MTAPWDALPLPPVMARAREGAETNGVFGDKLFSSHGHGLMAVILSGLHPGLLVMLQQRFPSGCGGPAPASAGPVKMHNRRKSWWRSTAFLRMLILFALAIGILNLAVNVNMNHVETARIAAFSSKSRSEEEFSKLRRLNEILIEDCNSKRSHYEAIVSNLTIELHNLEAVNSNLKDSRDSLISGEKEFKKNLFEANARYRAAETDYEISRSKESNLKDQLEAAKVREMNLVSQLEKLRREAKSYLKKNNDSLHLETVSAPHHQLNGSRETHSLQYVRTNRR